MPPRSIYFLPAALALLPACEVDSHPAPSSELRAPEKEQKAAVQAEASATAQADCGQAGDACCEGDSCSEGAECSDGVCVLPFLEPRALEAADDQ